jgi:hypothetical protein
MKRVYTTIGKNGLQIPLPLLQAHGAEPGARVVLEFSSDGILVKLPLTDPHIHETCGAPLSTGDYIHLSTCVCKNDPSVSG